MTQKATRKRKIFILYFSPYSPNLNPTERLWKVINEEVRNSRFFESVKEFRREIIDFFNATWPIIAMSMTDRINDNFQRLNSTV